MFVYCSYAMPHEPKQNAYVNVWESKRSNNMWKTTMMMAFKYEKK